MTRKRAFGRRPTVPVRFFRPALEEFEKRDLLATFMVLNSADGGSGSLRQAILDANATPTIGAPNLITFDIPGSGVRTITPLTDLPIITNPVVIDGYSQPGAAANTLAVGDNAVLLIELDGENIHNIGLWVGTHDSTFRGLVLNRFDGNAIQLDGDGNLVTGDFLGTDATGSTARGNTRNGVAVNGSGNIIGGTSPADRNVIAGNGASGIAFVGAGATGNVVLGNYIGTDFTGLAGLGNGDSAAEVLIDGAADNTIGGSAAGAGNVISGNGVFTGRGSSGIRIQGSGAQNNLIQANFIGTDVTGLAVLPNTLEGIDILAGAANNTVGGASASARNVIGGNDRTGVYISDTGSDHNVVIGNYIGTDVTGTAAFAQEGAGVQIENGAAFNQIGGLSAGERNVVAGGYGIQLDGSGSGNEALGNYINLDVTGEIVLGNPLGAISGGAPGSLIEGNVIAGNEREGIYLVGALAVGDVIRGNFIGTDATGTVALGNREGIRLDAQVSGALVIDNLISGNRGDGIDISGEYGPPGFNNLIVGNRIGTDVTGTKALGNGGVGISIGGSGNTAGGTSAADRNVIAANVGGGIFIGGGLAGTGTPAAGNLVEGNYIGTDVTGTVAMGNQGSGVILEGGAPNNTIGGGSAGAGNVIAASGADGVSVFGAIDTVVLGNFIGTDSAGTVKLGNTRYGIQIAFDGNVGNVIGGTGPGAGNVIAYSGAAGVAVADASTGNAIRGNSIHDNGGLGIDLGRDGVTPNDPGHGSSGPNDLEHFPVLALVRYGSITRVAGGLESLANAQFTLDFYASAAADPSGYGQGQRYLGSTTVTTDATGLATFASLPFTVGPSEVVTATATDAAGNTSEFSRAVVVYAVSTPVIWINPFGGDWDRSANWADMNTGDLRAPGAADDTSIDLGISLSVIHAANNADAARSLLSRDDLILSGGSLALGANSSVQAALTVSDGATLSDAGNLTVTGPLTLTGTGITSTGDQTYNGTVHTSGAASLSGANISFAAAVTADGTLSVTSAGGDTTFAGPLTGHDTITVASHANTVFAGAVSVDATLTVTSTAGATSLALGANLHAGRAAFNGALAIAMTGTVPVSLYNQIAVTDSLGLSGPLTLKLASGFAPDPGTQFVIADNRGGSAVGGTFAGLPEGAVILTTHGTFRISYRGGDGNDVVLTVVTPTIGVLSFNVDTGVPDDGLTGDRTPTFFGSATAGTAVTVYRDGRGVGSTTAGTDGHWTFTVVAPLADGAYLFTAVAADMAGRRSPVSPVLSLTIDGTAPAPPQTTGISPDTGTPGDDVTSDRNLIVFGTAEAGSTVTVYRGGRSAGSTTTGANGQWSIDFTAVTLPDGAYDFTAVATDRAGNQSTLSARLRVEIEGTAPPPPQGLAFTPDTSARDLHVFGSAGAGLTVDLARDGTVVGTATANGLGKWVYDFTTATLPDGRYEFTATAVNVAGVRSAPSDPLDVVISDPATPPLSLGSEGEGQANEPAGNSGHPEQGQDRSGTSAAGGLVSDGDPGKSSSESGGGLADLLPGIAVHAAQAFVFSFGVADGSAALAEAAWLTVSGARAMPLWAGRATEEFRSGGSEGSEATGKFMADGRVLAEPSPLLQFGQGKPLGLNNTVPEGEEGPAVIKQLFRAIGVKDPLADNRPVKGTLTVAEDGRDGVGMMAGPTAPAIPDNGGALSSRVGLLRKFSAVGLCVLGVLGQSAVAIVRFRKARARTPSPRVVEGGCRRSDPKENQDG